MSSLFESSHRNSAPMRYRRTDADVLAELAEIFPDMLQAEENIIGLAIHEPVVPAELLTTRLTPYFLETAADRRAEELSQKAAWPVVIIDK